MDSQSKKRELFRSYVCIIFLALRILDFATNSKGKEEQ